MHIPPSSFLRVQRREFGGVGMERAEFPGLNDDVPLDSQGSGTGDGQMDRAFMDALVQVGVHSVYSGHDHGDSWCGNWPDADGLGMGTGPKLCFCKHTG